MNETEIRRYGELMRELGLTGLEITDDKNKVRLERMGAAPKEQTYAVAGKEAGDTETSREAGGAAKDCVSVMSPIVGIFYAAPAENADPYVAAGERVKKGQTLCIVEAMKLMNEIVAEEDGVIAEVGAADGQVVEYGTELFRIRRQEDE